MFFLTLGAIRQISSLESTSSGHVPTYAQCVIFQLPFLPIEPLGGLETLKNRMKSNNRSFGRPACAPDFFQTVTPFSSFIVRFFAMFFLSEKGTVNTDTVIGFAENQAYFHGFSQITNNVTDT